MSEANKKTEMMLSRESKVDYISIVNDWYMEGISVEFVEFFDELSRVIAKDCDQLPASSCEAIGRFVKMWEGRRRDPRDSASQAALRLAMTAPITEWDAIPKIDD